MSEVDICNLALSHLGDTAAVMSIKPPDASVQAQLSARFYPIARNTMLEMASWGFATKRLQLAQVALPSFTDADGNTTNGTWLYAYATPSDAVNYLAVLSADATDDYEETLVAPDNLCPPYPQGYLPVPGSPTITPQPYTLEIDSKGNQILLTNVPDAVLRYTAAVTDTTQFSALFATALSYLLASMLAGPILKGDAGAAEAARQLGTFKVFYGLAEASDANQRKINVKPSPSWIRGR